MPLRLALAQIDPTVGDLEGNLALIQDAIDEARPLGPDLVAFPELVVTGYPPEDLLGYARFVENAEDVVDRIGRRNPDLRILIGAPIREGGELYNAAILMEGGRRAYVYKKCTLPNYGVFDEKRWFRPGRLCPVLSLGSCRIGLSICEDVWTPRGVHEIEARAGARILLNISASPYSAGKGAEREALLRHRARQHGVYLAYLNLTGGQDELVFDGQSLVVAPDGAVLARGRMFERDLLCVDIDPDAEIRPAAEGADPGFVQPRYEEIDDIEAALQADSIELGPASAGSRPPLASRPPWTIPSIEEEVYGALVLGTRDYVRKNGFREVVIGLSGGIDSALTAAIAVDALGADSVHGLTMPSPYTSETSLAGAVEVAKNLEISIDRIPIGPILSAYLENLRGSFGKVPLGITEENLQARIRGNILMAFSNARSWLVLTTGNKSELAVGYCTLYGDMAGGFAVIKDVPKDLVYRLARWRNARGAGVGDGTTRPIPEDTLTRPPSAELKPDQKDSDTLPPYPILDPILEARIEREEPPDALIARGFDPLIVQKVYAWIDGNEYKRRQAPPGIKITPRAFGRDRRYPITNRYRPGPGGPR